MLVFFLKTLQGFDGFVELFFLQKTDGFADLDFALHFRETLVLLQAVDDPLVAFDNIVLINTAGDQFSRRGDIV